MPFAGRLTVRGKIAVISGLHIGAGTAGGIGLIDAPLVRDPLTRRPVVPGSSLKGRLRHALEVLLGVSNPQVLRMFGAPVEQNKDNRTRLWVRDAVLTDQSANRLESFDTDSLYVEIKSENRINRATGVAEHPRQIERLPAGAELGFEFIYNVCEPEHVIEDLQNLSAALGFVEDEYLGGSGSRGYGKVAFRIDSLEWRSIEDYRSRRKGSEKATGSAWVEDAVELCKLAAAGTAS